MYFSIRTGPPKREASFKAANEVYAETSAANAGFKKVYDSDDYQKYLKDYALKGAFLSGADFVSWVEKKEADTKELMAKGDMLKK